MGWKVQVPWEPFAGAVVWAAGFFQETPPWLRPVLAVVGAAFWTRWVGRIDSAGRAGWVGWAAGTLFYVPVLAWLPGTVVTYSTTPGPVAWLLILLLDAYLGTYWGLWAWTVVRLRRYPWGAWAWPWVGALLWVGLSQVRSTVLTGFPWGQVETLLVEWPWVVQWADLLGGFALGGWLLLAGWALMGMANGEWRMANLGLAIRRSLRAIFVLILLWVLPWAYGRWAQRYWRAQAARTETLSVRIVQPSIPQDLKMTALRALDWFRRQVDLSYLDEPGRVQLVVWPEGSVPFYLGPDTVWWGLLQDLQSHNRAYLLLGADRWARRSPPVVHNSVFLLDPELRVVDFYDKVHLVPFGEYVPLASVLFFVERMVQGIGDFAPGTRLKPIESPWGRLGVQVCFESIFPDLSRRLVRTGARLLITVTNDAWFGRSSGAFQHLLHTRLRVVETRRAMLFVANSGISARLDPDGTLRWKTPLWVETAVDDGRVPLMTGGLTVWVRWGWAVDTLSWVATLGLLGLAGWPSRHVRQESQGPAGIDAA
ncbi:Apolipoprotein N-acyltransferase [bacterium HR11]|nr:Apolipoprotein N-acyltransferase [bacterium HR11]